jgi:Tol biopolymer transport system component
LIAPSTTQVDLNTSGGQPNNVIGAEYSVSDSGRYVAYSSYASDLVATDTNSAEDVFVYDGVTHMNTLVSVTSVGVQGDGASNFPSISGDGRYIAFVSVATTLVTGDTNHLADVFLKDLQTGTLTRISLDSNQNQETGGDSASPSMSVSGRYVAFTSSATNLVANDTNNAADVFLRDTSAQTTIRVSVTNGGSQADNSSTTNGPNSSYQVTSDGRYIAFQSNATNLVSGDTNGVTDAFVRDTVGATTVRASLAYNGAEPNLACTAPVLSADGRYVFFESNATNLVLNASANFEVYERDTVSGATTMVSVSPAGDPANSNAAAPDLSSSGRYVTFNSAATNLGPTGVTAMQLFLHDLATGLNAIASVDTGGNQMGAGAEGGMSADARYVPFSTLAPLAATYIFALTPRHRYRQDSCSAPAQAAMAWLVSRMSS